MKEGYQIKPEWVPEAYRETKHTGNITISHVGTFHYYCEREREYWFAISDSIVAMNKVEFSIDTHSKKPPTTQQIIRLEEIVDNVNGYKELLYNHLKAAHDELSLEDIRKMYLLAAIEIKIDCNEVRFTLEANPTNPSIYDGFKRFTVLDKEVIWSNVK